MSEKVRLLRAGSIVIGLLFFAVALYRVILPVVGESPPGETTTAPKPATAASESAGVRAKTEPEAETPQAERGLTLWTIIRLGGPLMWPLFALSFAFVAFVTYYLLAFSPGNIMPPTFLRRLQQIIQDRRIDEAKIFCAQNKNIASHIIRSGLEALPKGRQAVVEAMNSEGSRRGGALWLKISFLSDIAVVSPMVGLLGTVVGMFQAFMSVSGTVAKGGALTVGKVGGATVGAINPAALTSGVAQAVITTIAGLMIAIPATLAYSYFRAVVQKIIVNLEAVCSRYSEIIAEAKK